MSKLSRNKGKTEERRVAALYRKIYPDTRRGWQARQGDDEPDLVNTGPYGVECKHRKVINVRASWAQCEANAAKAGKVPVLHLHWHRGERLVVVDEVDWVRIVRGIYLAGRGFANTFAWLDEEGE